MKSIGVIIPSKNYAHYIADALRSLIAQETPLRVVIVNDGGNDGQMLDSVAVAFRTPDVSVDVIHMPTSRGIGLARNTGAAYLNTDFFLFLDADDWLYEGALDALHRGLIGFDIAFSYGNYTENGQTTSTLHWMTAHALLKGQNIASYCNLWKRESFWQIGGYSNVPVAEDWDLQKRAAKTGLVGAHVDALIFEHRLHDKNKWTADALAYGGMAGVAKILEAQQ